MFATKTWVKELLSKVLKKTVNNYSLEEQRVGTWIDGKPIYQKTIECIMPQVTTDGTAVTISINHNIQNLNIFTNINAIISTKDYTFTLPWVTVSGNNRNPNSIHYDKTKNALMLVNRAKAYNDGIIYATLQYTKTTD